MEKTERDDLEYAGFWIRAWAFLIDGFFLTSTVWPVFRCLIKGKVVY